MSQERDHLSKTEIRKDAVQDSVEVTLHAVSKVGGTVINAVGDIARTVGGLATDLFEIADGARKAQADHGASSVESAAAPTSVAPTSAAPSGTAPSGTAPSDTAPVGESTSNGPA